MGEQQLKVWHVSKGKRRHGPMTARRVRRHLRAGKLAPANLAWREGQDEWVPLLEIPEFARITQAVSEAATTVEDAPEADSDSSVETAAVPAERPAPAGEASVAPERTFEPPHRIEPRDLWQAFRIGTHRSRVLFALAVLGGAGALAVVVAAATWLHVILGALTGLAAAVVVPIVTLAGAGGLAYQARCAIGEERTPTVRETLTFVRRHLLALGGVPFAISLAAALPLIALALIGLLVKIPYLGPVATGLTFGLHLVLSAAALFLAVSGSFSWVLAPIVVGFEQTGPVETAKVLFDLVKRSTVRLILWSIKPQLAFSAMTVGLVLLWAAILVPPVALVGGMAGGQQVAAALSGAGGPDAVAGLSDALVPGALLGAVPGVLWIGLALALLAAILFSVQNAIVSMVYLGCREGNDERIARDTYLAQRRTAKEAA